MSENRFVAANHALHQLALDAQEGSKDALEQLIQQIQQPIYELALRFLLNPADAEDAGQDIIIRLITHLGSFRGDSKFTTWAYQVACNHLINYRNKHLGPKMNFVEFSEDLQSGLSEPPAHYSEPTHQRLLDEIKIGCTLAMLQCLSEDARLAYIIGEVLELDHNEGATALNITSALYRKRLSRAREKIHQFMQDNCAIINTDNPCHCSKRVQRAQELGRVDPNQLFFANSDPDRPSFTHVQDTIQQLDQASRSVALYRSHPHQTLDDNFTAWLRKIIATRSHDGHNWTETLQ